ncbi:MAG: type II secretion system protein [Microgenomates group bacterium]
MKKGFTLVELLIVIGLLGAIALIVISAINPIEQSNRTRDTRFRTDGGQVISAIDRFFASHSKFPWEACAGTSCPYTSGSDDAFGFVSAGHEGIGLCGADCSADGVLITNDELKTEFRGRDFIRSVTSPQDSSGQIDKKLFIGKEDGSSESVYACFIPLAKATRDKAITDSKVYSLDFSSGVRTSITTCTTADQNWTSLQCYVCIPD